MHFDGEAFISYAHLDNLELVEGHKGWVTNLHRALEIRVAQLLGKEPKIWRDPKLSGNDLFAETIAERLRRVAILVAVVSPRYLKSDWTLRELNEFWAAAEQQGCLRVKDKARVFKVLKTPVPLERTPPILRSLLGYDFFKVDPDTGKVRELDEVFGPEAQRDFWIRLDDLAHDICNLIEALETDEPPSAPVAAAPAQAAPAAPVARGNGEAAAVFLAETTSDLREQREVIRRDLLQHKYVVLPDQVLPHVADEAEAVIADQIARSRMSVHLVGRHYGVVPEGSERSLVEMQYEQAIACAGRQPLSRLVWIPDGLDVQDERQRRTLDRMRMDPRIRQGADLLETYFEDLRTTLQDWLRRAQVPVDRRTVETPASDTEPPRLYLIADQRDVERIDAWADALFDEGLEVYRPMFQGDEREIREYHEENLATCDGALIFFGSGNELWLRRKLRELQKAAGYGRTKPKPSVGICLMAPRTAEKERFRTHEAVVVPQWDGVAMDSLRPLVAVVKAGGPV